MKVIIHLLTIVALAVSARATTLQQFALSQPACRPGYGITATVRFDEAQPVGVNYKAFVHIVNSAWVMAFQADHDLPTPTTQWSGTLTYDLLLSTPPNLPPGTYTVYTGLYNPPTGAKLPMAMGPGVTDAAPNGNYYKVATFTVSPTAPLPKIAPSTLDLSNYHVTFNEDFTGALSVSSRGNGTRWAAHMPDVADFGSGKFADPISGFPFTVADGMLRIQGTKKAGIWQSGLLASISNTGAGFTQQYGYFEMQAKLPKGEGLWPAFWLMKPPTANDKNITRVEIDVLEQYGARPNTLSSTIHFWGPGTAHRTIDQSISVPAMTDDMHRYGVMIEADYTTFYFDGTPYWQIVTPEEAKVPLYILVDLAFGGGWPITNLPASSYLVIDYIRAYAKD